MRPHYRLGWIVALAVARALYGFRVLGGDRVPRTGPVVIACNHVSGWDPILVGLAVRREVHFLAKEELFAHRALGRLISAFNAIPVRRGGLDRRALAAATAALRRQGALLVFPEGTRSADGQFGPPKAGVGFLAARTGAAIVPAYIRGTRALGEAARRRRPVEVAFGDAFTPDGGCGGDAYRAATERAMESIRRLKEEAERP